ncbi:MAG: Lar family restriction alleviation protein [Lachnospiraceae bacterium]|nr:Lar family restriction alleviation protein [Lachnospiraceae bacterium]
MEELKKCPFCGGEAELIKYKHREYASTFAVSCKGNCIKQYDYRDKDRAIEAWNNRVNEFDAEKYEKLVLADMERKHTEQQLLLSELKAVLPTTTEAEIRAKAYDRFLTEMLNEFDSKNADVENHTGSYVVSRLHEIAEQLKEE